MCALATVHVLVHVCVSENVHLDITLHRPRACCVNVSHQHRLEGGKECLACGALSCFG